MANRKLDRRQILRGAGALGAVGALAMLRDPVTGFAKDGTGLEGAWLVSVTETGPNAHPPYKELHSYAVGGVFINTGQGETTGSYPNGGAHGAWVTTGERQFADTAVLLFTDTAGNFTGTGRIRERLTLAEIGEAFSGSRKFDFFNPDGSLGFSKGGTVKATRIRVKPF